jgi:hypothetical protein
LDFPNVTHDAALQTLSSRLRSRGFECAGLLAGQILRHGVEYARGTVVLAFHGAVWDALDELDSRQAVGAFWSRLSQSPSKTKVEIARQGRALDEGDLGPHNVAQYILCLVFGRGKLGQV